MTTGTAGPLVEHMQALAVEVEKTALRRHSSLNSPARSEGEFGKRPDDD